MSKRSWIIIAVGVTLVLLYFKYGTQMLAYFSETTASDTPKSEDNELDNPKGNEDKPKGSEDKPKGSEDKPKGSEDKPKGSEDKPKGSEDKPKPQMEFKKVSEILPNVVSAYNNLSGQEKKLGNKALMKLIFQRSGYAEPLVFRVNSQNYDPETVAQEIKDIITNDYWNLPAGWTFKTNYNKVLDVINYLGWYNGSVGF
jgi:cobalamin biosynthesis protein CobT